LNVPIFLLVGGQVHADVMRHLLASSIQRPFP